MQVSVFDTIDKSAGYNLKVRRLGAFHPKLAGKAEPDAQDIADPLYGEGFKPKLGLGGFQIIFLMRCGASGEF